MHSGLPRTVTGLWMLQVSTSNCIVIVENDLYGHIGAGNSFLGGLAAGLHFTGDIAEGDSLPAIKG